MKTKQLRPVCSLGMFDFFKGITLLSIVIMHTVELFFDINDFGSVGPAFFNIGSLMMCAFFIAAGYGVRKRPARKCLSQIWKSFLKPYLYALVLTPILLIVVHTLSFHYLPGAVMEGLHILTGFALGQYPTASYFGWVCYSCGPLWFVVALAIAWFIFNTLLNRVSEKWLHWTAAAIGMLGYLGGQLTAGIPLPFCIMHSMVAVPGLYLGYWAKKTRFFEKKPTALMWGLFALGMAVFLIKYDELISFSEHQYPLGILSLMAAYIIGMAILYLMTHINRRYNALVNVFETIGHVTINILVLHAIESHGMLWYRVAEQFADRPGLGAVVIFVLRSLFIAVGLLVISAFKKWGGFDRLLKHSR